MPDNKKSRIKWLWRYSNQDGDSPVAQGKLFTKAKPGKDGFYTVTDIKGKRDGVNIKELLPAGTGIPGNVDTISATTRSAPKSSAEIAANSPMVASSFR